ncbi:MAG: PocR ligand-binding domain-containing protein [Syntrophobacteraceae bacterium]
MKREEKNKEQIFDELAQLRRKVPGLDEKITACEFAGNTAMKREGQFESEVDVLLATESEVDAEELAECIDIVAIQDLMDSFHKVKSVPFAIIDLKGNILVAAGWQDICTKFHRVHPETSRKCVESDLYLSGNVEQGKYVLYRCKNNMWDVATPIIAGNRHIANLFIGQFFFEDEVPDHEIFVKQARMYGFNEEEYLKALDLVPRLSRETVRDLMEFYTGFANLVSTLSYGNIKLARLLSENIRQEKALRESEGLYRTLVSLSPDSISVADTNGLLTFASSKTKQIFGHSPEEEILGRSLLGWVAPKDKEKASANIRKLVTEGTHTDTEFTLIKKDGTCFNGEINASVIRSPDNSPKNMILITRDITERKRVEEELRNSEKRYRTIFNNAVEGIFQTTLEGRFRIINPAFARMLGYGSPEEVMISITNIGEQLYARPEDRNRFTAIISAAEGMVRDFEVQLRRKDGSLLWVSINSVIIRNGEDDAPFFEGTFIDITDRKRAEEALRQSEWRETTLNRIFQIFLTVPDEEMYGEILDVVLDVMKSKFGLFGYIGEKGDFIIPSLTRNIWNECHVSDKSIAFAPDAWGNSLWGRAIRERKPFISDGPFQVPKGHIDIDHFLAVPVIFGKETIGLISVADKEGGYTEEDKELLVEIANRISPILNARLQRDIQERERKKAEMDRRLLEERLQRAEKMEALGTLAGGVAHDLNNVLGIVVGYSELLLDDLNKSGSARSEAMEILKGGQRASAIVQDMLTLARRGVQGKKVLNLNNIILECRNSPEFAAVLSHHPSIRIKMELEPDLLNISGSSVHQGKSFMNLVYNAAEAMPNGGTLTVRTANCYLDRPISGYDEVREGDYVVLSISDTGEGIPPSDLKRIFEPFYTKKVMGRSGTGLGLAVVWGTVKDHHGYINVESKEGEGATFTLYFPVTREAVAPEQVAVSVAEFLGKGESVLVVDDVKEQRELARIMLEKLNYTVKSISSGEEAVEYLKHNTVDLVVLDMIMDPGMDGLATYIKILETHPRQKAIIVSGFSETERVTKAQELGAGAYVKKPYVLEKLGMAVRKELDQAR